MKTALIRTKKLRKMDKSPPSKSLQEKAAWMQQVIEEEQRKPLQVSKDFIQRYEEQERTEEERLENEVRNPFPPFALSPFPLPVRRRFVELTCSPAGGSFKTIKGATAYRRAPEAAK